MSGEVYFGNEGDDTIAEKVTDGGQPPTEFDNNGEWTEQILAGHQSHRTPYPEGDGPTWYPPAHEVVDTVDDFAKDKSVIGRNELGAVVVAMRAGLNVGHRRAADGESFHPRSKNGGVGDELSARYLMQLKGDRRLPSDVKGVIDQSLETNPTAVRLAEADEANSKPRGKFARASRRVAELVDKYKFIGVALPFLSNLDVTGPDGRKDRRVQGSEILGYLDRFGTNVKRLLIGTAVGTFAVMSIPGFMLGYKLAPDEEEVEVPALIGKTLDDMKVRAVTRPDQPVVIPAGTQYELYPQPVQNGDDSDTTAGPLGGVTNQPGVAFGLFVPEDTTAGLVADLPILPDDSTQKLAIGSLKTGDTYKQVVLTIDDSEPTIPAVFVEECDGKPGSNVSQFPDGNYMGGQIDPVDFLTAEAIENGKKVIEPRKSC